MHLFISFILTFLEGDPDRPLVTGAVYNGLHNPPYSLPDNKTRTTFRTQTHKGDGYNELSFEDEANQEEEAETRFSKKCASLKGFQLVTRINCHIYHAEFIMLSIFRL